ncbi:MAG: transporter ATP-binding protein [Rhodospirillales bacterium]|jgi:branched-chain amino acid transport system ATP-binding protein|nr:transporter ATP-binding protein [Rhodospirillales bacterium]
MNPLLAVESITAGYGATIVLEDVSLTLDEGSACAILGRNGVGKTTLMSTIMGQTTLHRGTLGFAGKDITGRPPYQRARGGIGFVPQEREIFPSLTVEENLTVAMRPGVWRLAGVYDFFPRLAERRSNMGNQLSGGEQQMLAIGRALMGNPRLLLMDEPLEGLAPVIVDMLLTSMHRLRREAGLTILLVEQHAERALDLAETALILDRGKIVYDGDSATLLREPERLAALIGVGRAVKRI